jgi:hypothetical protein
MYEVLNKIDGTVACGKISLSKVALGYIAAQLCGRGSVAEPFITPQVKSYYIISFLLFFNSSLSTF